MENIVICSVIKNDSLYLKEWLDYHISIGFENIFLYEFYDSESHSGITKDYENVFLKKISDIPEINKDMFINDIKKVVYDNFVKEHKNIYDWCAFIDVNDFIHIDNIDKLDEMINVPAICMNWKNLYGANGLLERVDGNVRDVFSKKINGTNDADPSNPLYSLLVNLKCDDVVFYDYNIVGCMITNESETHKNDFIHIDRYITKSFEEWCARIINNDYVGGFKANFARFFFINKDMIHLTNIAYDMMTQIAGKMNGFEDDYAIFIHTHKNIPNKIPTDRHYIISATNRDITSNTHKVLYIDDEFTEKHNVSYGETCTMHYLWKHQELIPKYIGLNHYRRFFVDFFDIPSNVKKNVDKYGAIVSFPYSHENGNNRTAMNYMHIGKDVILLRNIISDFFPDYIVAFREMLDSSYQYPCNLFVMKKEDFIEMCDFVFGVMELYDIENGLTCDADVISYVKETEGKDWDFMDVNWQKRLEGFWIEWLTETYYRYKWGVDNVYKARFYLVQ